MKRLTLILTAVCLSVAGVLLLRNPVAADAPASPPGGESIDRLVVHEWGTFTTFSGSDGVRLDFRPLDDNDLPDFVGDRALQSGESNPFLKSRVRATVRMETPVTYFYTDRERDVRVRVGFPQGLLTEFYPPVARMEPAFSWKNASNGETIGGGLLDWGTVHLIPTNHLQTHITDTAVASRVQQRMFDALVPPAPNANHYAYARETDSALVHVDFPFDLSQGSRPFGSYFEKFLFYRGVGKFELPLKLESISERSFRLANAGPEAVHALFLVTVRNGAIRFNAWDALKAGGEMTLEEPQTEASVEALSEAVVASLLREGLYEKEARAMVKTWKSSWFGEEGTRLFYVVPRRLTDAVLPLTVEPVPQETVRVLVGRMEILSRRDEARMLEVVRMSTKLRADFATVQQQEQASGHEPPKYPLPEEIAQLGRLAEPALVRLRTIAKEDTVRFEAARLLSELTAELQNVPQEQ